MTKLSLGRRMGRELSRQLRIKPRKPVHKHLRIIIVLYLVIVLCICTCVNVNCSVFLRICRSPNVFVLLHIVYLHLCISPSVFALLHIVYLHLCNSPSVLALARAALNTKSLPDEWRICPPPD